MYSSSSVTEGLPVEESYEGSRVPRTGILFDRRLASLQLNSFLTSAMIFGLIFGMEAFFKLSYTVL